MGALEEVAGHSDALKNYNLGARIDYGEFGKVKIPEHNKTGHKVAINIINCRQMRTMGMEEKSTYASL
jgi:5'-AMP-activated protein kinase catalytic alpha subunit